MNEQQKRGLLMSLERKNELVPPMTLVEALDFWNKNMDEEHRFYVASNYEGTCIAHPKSFNQGELKEVFSEFPEIFDKVFVITGKEEQFIDKLQIVIILNALKKLMTEECKEIPKVDFSDLAKNNDVYNTVLQNYIHTMEKMINNIDRQMIEIKVDSLSDGLPSVKKLI